MRQPYLRVNRFLDGNNDVLVTRVVRTVLGTFVYDLRGKLITDHEFGLNPEAVDFTIAAFAIVDKYMAHSVFVPNLRYCNSWMLSSEGMRETTFSTRLISASAKSSLVRCTA